MLQVESVGALSLELEALLPKAAEYLGHGDRLIKAMRDAAKGNDLERIRWSVQACRAIIEGATQRAEAV